MGSRALRSSLEAAARIRSVTGCQVFVDTFMARLEGGVGLPAFDALPYFPEQAIERLSGVEGMVVAGSQPPVAFFGYKHLHRSELLPEGCECRVVCGLGVDSEPSLTAMAEALEAPAYVHEESPQRPAEPEASAQGAAGGKASKAAK